MNIFYSIVLLFFTDKNTVQGLLGSTLAFVSTFLINLTVVSNVIAIVSSVIGLLISIARFSQIMSDLLRGKRIDNKGK
jgi:ABC-type amino acid transport system permease subunit